MNTVLLIILIILIFKFSQKCLSEHLNNKPTANKPIANKPIANKPTANQGDYGLMYGTTPVNIGSSFDLNYIRNNNQNKLEIPSSKIALKRLMENSSYECRRGDPEYIKSHSDHILIKKKVENINKKKVANNTTIRNAVEQS